MQKRRQYEFATDAATVTIIAYDRWQAKRMARRTLKRRPVYLIEDGRKIDVLFDGRRNWARLTRGKVGK